MSVEELYIKNIENGIRALKLRTKTPAEINIGVNLNRLKAVNEGLYQDYLDKYKKVLKEYNNGNDIKK